MVDNGLLLMIFLLTENTPRSIRLAFSGADNKHRVKYGILRGLYT
jgi:hypothetical protein